MGKTFDVIDDRLRRFLTGQPMFFVATAPLDASGYVNVSPKGLDSFRVLGPTEVAYLDCTGSGAETLAHLRENGRITLMFCAFEGPPKILRLYGQGRAVEPGDDAFAPLRELFPPHLTARSIIRIQIQRIADSCGWGVPLLSHEGDRTQLLDWAERKGPDGIEAYQREKNATSIDGLPALRSASAGAPGNGS